MTTTLADARCIPCRKGAAALAPSEREPLLEQLPQWRLAEDARSIHRRYGFSSFADAFAFASRIAAIADAQDHHPELCIGWGMLTVSLHTHVIGALHRNDFILAAQIEHAFRTGAAP